MAGGDVIVRNLVSRWMIEADDSQLKEANKALEKARDGLKKLALGANAALLAIVVPAAMMDGKLKDIEVQANKTGEGLSRSLMNAAMEMGENLSYATDEVLDVFRVAAREAEPLSDDFNKISEASLKLSKMDDQLQGAESVNILTRNMAAFGIEAQGAEHAAAVLWTGAKEGNVELSELARGMKATAASSKLAKVGFDDTVAIVATLARELGDVRKAGAAYDVLMSTIAQKGYSIEGLRKQFEGLSEAQAKSKALALMGTSAYEPLLLLLGSKNFDGIKEAVANADSLFDKAFQARLDSAAESIGDLKDVIVNIAKVLGFDLLPEVGKVMTAATNAAREVRRFLSAHPEFSKMIGTVIGLTAATSTLGFVVLAATIAFSKLTLAMLAPAAAVALIVLAGLAFEDLYHFIKGNDSLLGSLLDKYPRFGAAISAVGAVITTVAIAAAVALAPILVLLVALSAAVLMWWMNWDELKEAVRFTVEDIKARLGRAIDWIVEKFEYYRDKAKEIIKEVGDLWDYFLKNTTTGKVISAFIEVDKMAMGKDFSFLGAAQQFQTATNPAVAATKGSNWLSANWEGIADWLSGVGSNIYRSDSPRISGGGVSVIYNGNTNLYFTAPGGYGADSPDVYASRAALEMEDRLKEAEYRRVQDSLNTYSTHASGIYQDVIVK